MQDLPHLSAEPSPAGTDPVFGHVLVGIDDTPESLVAAVQADVLLARDGRLVLVAVAERYLASHTGLLAADAGRQLASVTNDELERARALVTAHEALILSGRLVHVLRHECGRRHATLIAVGSRPHRRLPALALGGHEVEALRDGTCSILVARPGWGPHPPERIVVAFDGSPESRAAEDVARALGARLGREVVTVVGLDDAVGLAALGGERAHAVLHPGDCADAVESVATKGSLVLVGRAAGHDGRRTGGDVEKIVFGVQCSVLVVEHTTAAGE